MSFLTTARVFARSLWLQASWSFEGMQAMGIGYAMEPVLDEVYGREGKERLEAAKRYAQTFNTHPYLSTAIIGCAASLERGGNGDKVKSTINAVMGPYGGVGDSFFWGSLKPLLAVLAMVSVVMGHVVAPLLFLFIWLSLSLGARVWFYRIGLEKGQAGLAEIMNMGFLPRAKRMKLTCALLLGFYCGYHVMGVHAGVGFSLGLLTVAAVVFAYLVSLGARRGLDPMWVILAGAILLSGMEIIK